MPQIADILNIKSPYWRGLTNHTANHNRISYYAVQVGILSGLLASDLNKEIRIDYEDEFDIFGQKVYVKDFYDANQNIQSSKLHYLIIQSHLPDVYDKGIVERRLYHANLNGEWVRNFVKNHEAIMEYTEGDYDDKTKALMIGYNLHYLQDAISPQHTIYRQEHHFEVEHVIDNTTYYKGFQTHFNALVYKYGMPRFDFMDVYDIVDIANKIAWNGTKYANSGLAGLVHGKQLEFNRWIYYYLYNAIMISLLYLYQFYGV